MIFSFLRNYRLVSTLLLLSSSIALSNTISEASQLSREEYIKVDQYTIYLHSAGNGSPAVIFEAGLGWDSPTWQQVAPEVSKFTRTIVYDRVGLGKSSLLMPDSGPVTAQAVVTRLKKSLDKAQIPPPYILVGQSVGGLYMQLFAREYPKEVAGLVLVDSVSINDPFQDPLPERSEPYYYEAEGVAGSKIEIKRAPPFPNIPVIVLAAGRHQWATAADKQRLLAAQKTLAQLSPQGQFILVKDSGHYIQNDQPEVVIQAIHLLFDRTENLTYHSK